MHFLTLLASSDEPASTSGSLLGMLPLLLLPLLAYFLLIRPNRRRMREQQDMQSGLEIGDEVITTSGIYGFITGFDGDRVWVEVDDDVQLRMAKAAIQGKIDTSTPTDAPASPAPAPDADTDGVATDRTADE